MGPEHHERSLTRVVLAAIVGLNVLVFGALALAGVPLLHLGSADAAENGSDARFIPLAGPAPIPAGEALREVLTGEIAGAKPAGEIWASSGTPFDKACPSSQDPTPVISLSRPFRSGGRTVSVQLAAHGAGQGAAAISALLERIGTCPATGATGASIGPTSTAVSAWAQTATTNASVLLWNRGDVVASVTTPRNAPGGLAAVAAAVDTALLAELRGVCVSRDVTVEDAGRSPWSVFPFTGRLVPRPVPLEYADPSASPTPVIPEGATLFPVPAPTLPVPQLASPPEGVVPLPDQPVAPVATQSVPGSDAVGPVKVIDVAPSPPVAPSSPPTTLDVDELLDDPTGPGCGWAFTRQGVPAFDADAAQARFTVDLEAARQELRDLDAAWQRDQVTYSVEYARYVEELRLFADYAARYNDWVARSRAAAYDELLVAYEAAVATREAWDAQREAAQSAYDAAVAACEAAGSPTASPTPTEPVPTDPAFPTPTPDPTSVCPPPVPPILSETPPEVPPSPEPAR